MYVAHKINMSKVIELFYLYSAPSLSVLLEAAQSSLFNWLLKLHLFWKLLQLVCSVSCYSLFFFPAPCCSFSPKYIVSAFACLSLDLKIPLSTWLIPFIWWDPSFVLHSVLRADLLSEGGSSFVLQGPIWERHWLIVLPCLMLFSYYVPISCFLLSSNSWVKR